MESDTSEEEDTIENVISNLPLALPESTTAMLLPLPPSESVSTNELPPPPPPLGVGSNSRLMSTIFPIAASDAKSSEQIRNTIREFITNIEKSNNVKFDFFLKEIQCTLAMESKEGDFFIDKAIIKKRRISTFNTMYRVSFNYFIPNVKKEFQFICKKDFRNTTQLFEWILEILWVHKRCPECLGLSENNICYACAAVKNSWEFAVAKNYTQYFPVCTICFDSVFTSRLECGHYFHKTCIVEYCRKNTDDVLKCPNCRTPFSRLDRQKFYIDE